ncbi:MAG: ATP translocase [Gammaproteobacteria bacterium]|nr:ATP translocase [Gammaproteobacteria bacterium]
MSDRRTQSSWQEASRALALFINFLLIILAYYCIKPASRSLLIEYYGADNFPYVWIGTAVVLGALIGPYSRLVATHSRFRVVQGSCLSFIVLFVAFRMLLGYHSGPAAVAFYVFVDIFSVVLVEQFWSLANTIYTTREGRRWYGFVATGGLLGGVVGGVTAAAILHYTTLETVDLLPVSAAILGLVLVLNQGLARMRIYTEAAAVSGPGAATGGWQALAGSRYLFLIAAILLFAQLCQPIVEFQFIKAVEAAYTRLDERTAFISTFFSQMGLFSIAVNLVITPLLLRHFGVLAGLVAQPLTLAMTSLFYFAQPTLVMASVMKIADRGLSYSINRASKELLYIPIDPVQTYRAKAWIDMFGYRLFKVLGSVLILLATQWLPVTVPTPALAWVTIAICVAWIGVVVRLTAEYRSLSAAPQPV